MVELAASIDRAGVRPLLSAHNAYMTRLDTNCSDISARVDPPPAQINGELIYGTNIDSELRALLCAT